MAMVLMIPGPNIGYANGRTYSNTNGVLSVPDFDALLLINQGWTELSTGEVAVSGGGIGLKSAAILAQSGTPVSVTGTTTETVQATIPIPAGSVGPNGVLRITPLWSAPVNADSNTYRCRVAGTVLFATTLANDGSFSPIITARNTGSALVALGGTSLGVGGSGSAPTSLTVDMTAPQSLTITAQLANASDTVTLLGYTVELLNP